MNCLITTLWPNIFRVGHYLLERIVRRQRFRRNMLTRKLHLKPASTQINHPLYLTKNTRIRGTLPQRLIKIEGEQLGYADALLAFTSIYVAGFAGSWGPLGWLAPSEILPLETKCKWGGEHVLHLRHCPNLPLHVVPHEVLPLFLLRRLRVDYDHLHLRLLAGDQRVPMKR